MIESPLIQEIVDEAITNKQRATITLILSNHFGAVPADVLRALNTIGTEAELDALSAAALTSKSLDEFRSRLPS